MTGRSPVDAATRSTAWHARLRSRLERLLAPRRARRRAVVAWSVLLAVTAVTSLAGRLQDPETALLVLRWSDRWLKTEPFYLFLLAALVGGLLRIGVGQVADLPDEAIDERLIAVRDRSYLLAYRIISAVVAMLVVMTYIVMDAVRTSEISAAVAAWAAGDAIWTLMPLLFFLPSAVLAWTSPDVVDDDPALDGPTRQPA